MNPRLILCKFEFRKEQILATSDFANMSFQFPLTLRIISFDSLKFDHFQNYRVKDTKYQSFDFLVAL